MTNMPSTRGGGNRSTPIPKGERQVLTADEVAAMAGLSPRTVRDRVQKNGHVLGVTPVPDTGRRVVFSRVLVERALGCESRVAS